MKKETLLGTGLTEAQAEAVLKLHKEEIDGQYIPKHRFDEVNNELKTVKEQVSERDKQITELKKFEGDSKALTEKIKELEDANKQKDTEYQTTLAKERKKNAVKLALLEDEDGKPHDVDMVMGLFDIDNIVLDETGKITSGYKEQNETIRKEKTFLFTQKAAENNNNNPNINIKGNTPKDGDKTPPPNTAEAYGQSLAQVKLGMMGVNTTSNKEA